MSLLKIANEYKLANGKEKEAILYNLIMNKKFNILQSIILSFKVKLNPRLALQYTKDNYEDDYILRNILFPELYLLEQQMGFNCAKNIIKYLYGV